MPLRVGVIGVGSLGQHHARILATMPGAELAGIADVNVKRARSISRKLKTRYVENFESLFDNIDAAVVAVPTASHYAIAHAMLSRGIHCMVEKPITDTVEKAEHLVSLALKKNLILQIGHVERFNQAILKAQEFIDRPKFIEVNRLGPYDPRVAYIGVIMDLMIHDLDIVMSLVNSPVESMESFGARLISPYEDIAKVRIRFGNGCVADFSASRISLERYRKIRIFQEKSYISIDYASPFLKIYRKKHDTISSLKDLEIIKPKLTKSEPLRNELKHFIGCIQTGKKPKVSGEHGRDALELAIEILKNINMNN